MFANRGIYHDGWYRLHDAADPPWLRALKTLPPIDYKWELYNLTEDYSQANDLAAKYPDKLKEMQALFLTEEPKYQVLPLDNRAFPRSLTPRPSATAGGTSSPIAARSSGIPVADRRSQPLLHHHRRHHVPRAAPRA